jgi:hypothetical protein
MSDQNKPRNVNINDFRAAANRAGKIIEAEGADLLGRAIDGAPKLFDAVMNVFDAVAAVDTVGEVAGEAAGAAGMALALLPGEEYCPRCFSAARGTPSRDCWLCKGSGKVSPPSAP